MTYLKKAALLSLTALLPFTANSMDLLDINDFPKWFQESMEREIEITATTQLKIEKFNVDSEIKGNFNLAEQGDGTWYYTVDIGTASPVECYVFSEFDGPANSLYLVIEHALSGVETLNNKKLVSTFNYAVDSGVISGIPYVSLDTLYNLGEGDEKVSGIIKAITAQTGESLQMCMHNEVGFRDSFFALSESFFKAFDTKQANENFFEVVYKVSINGMPMGFIKEAYAKDADGDVAMENKSALLIPVDQSSVARTDSLSISYSSPDGSLINAYEYTIENGVMASEFTLSSEDDKWQANGQMQGKEITATLEYDGWLLTGFGSYIELANLRSSDEVSGEYYMWSPAADPTTALKVTLKELVDEPKANFEVDMGVLKMKFLADDKNIFRQGTLLQGPISMNMELVHVVGEPKLP